MGSKIEKYRKEIISLLEYYNSIPSQTPKAEEMYDQLIIDEKHDHYAIMTVGWEGSKRIYFTSFHIDIINEKIWVQEDNTDCDIVGELESRGIPKSDIVLAFHAPRKRSFTAYATA